MTQPPDAAGSARLDWQIRREAESLAREFAGVFGRETIERFIAESLEGLRGARAAEFVPLLAWRFARERLIALAQAEGAMMKERPEILYVCVHNAGRSQMAAVLTDSIGQGRVHVRSAGTDPAEVINPAVVEAMREIGLDLSKEFPKPLTDEVVRAADVVITMGCGDACPIYPGKRYLDWELDDPANQPIETVRRIREDIRARVESLLHDLEQGEVPPAPRVDSAGWAASIMEPRP
ncbi:MAG: arsenate reductase ArsC [Dehalococcoidia bacterium]